MDLMLQKLVSQLEPWFARVNYRFRKKDQLFSKKDETGNVLGVSIDLLRASAPGFFKIALHAHIRIDELELVYAKYNPYLSAADQRTNFTINVNCDNLFRDLSATTSVRLREESMAVEAERIWEAIRDDVLPFLGEFSQRYRLVKNLAQSEPLARVVSDPLARYSILMSDAALDGDEKRFQEYRAEFLEHCESPHGRMYLPAAEAIANGIEADFFNTARPS